MNKLLLLPVSFLEVLPTNFFIDLYDLGKSILEFDWTWGGLADIGLNVVGLIPGVGDLAKASKLGKNAIKTVDAVADVTDGLNDARKAIKRTDALVDASKAAKNVGNGAKLTKKSEDTVKYYRVQGGNHATEKSYKRIEKGEDGKMVVTQKRSTLHVSRVTRDYAEYYLKGRKGSRNC